MQILFSAKKPLTGFAAFLLATTILPAAAYATPIIFSGTLSGASEQPPTVSPGTGSALVILDPVANTLQVEVSFSGLLGPTTASHIHCCQASPGVGSVMVATTTPTFPGFPLGVTFGTYDQTFDLTQASSYNPAFITSAFNPTGTIAGAEDALIAGLENGETYLNIHTTVDPGGEVRAPLLVPEPDSPTMFGVALAGLAGMLRFKRHRTRRPA